MTRVTLTFVDGKVIDVDFDVEPEVARGNVNRAIKTGAKWLSTTDERGLNHAYNLELVETIEISDGR